MPKQEQEQNTPTLIAGITPYFLERGVLPVPERTAKGGSASGWFEENFEAIRKKAKVDPWWRDHTLFLEPGVKLPYSPFLRKLTDLGYAKISRVEQRGEFSSRGGIVDVFPINLGHPIRIEFSGNVVERILPIPLAEEPKPVKLLPSKTATEYERLWLAGLKAGDYLVHLDHGIGIFQGMEGHYYALEYAPPRKGGMPDRLLVPRTQAKKISRYIGFETPAIHRLGGTAWEGTVRKAKEAARKFAQELMALYSKRAAA